MNCCYIIYSEELNKHYIGICQDSLEKRIETHNTHEYGEYRFTERLLVLKN